MLKPILIAVGVFLVFVAFIADNLSSDISTEADETAQTAQPVAAEIKPFTGQSGPKTVDLVSGSDDIEGTGADPEINTDPFASDGDRIDPFSAAPIDSFGNDNVDVRPDPSIAENTVDHAIEHNHSAEIFGSTSQSGSGQAAPSAEQVQPIRRSESKH